jgi:hypothetical protein
LGAALKLDYDPARGATVISGALDALVCQVTGHTVVAPGAGSRPTYTAADSAYKGKPTFTTAATGTKVLNSSADAGSDLIAASSLPYVAWVGALPATGVGDPYLWALQGAPEVTLGEFSLTVSDLATDALRLVVNNVAEAAYTGFDANPHLYECWIDGTGRNIAIDGVTVGTSGGAGGITTAVRRVHFGTRVSIAGYGDGTTARFIASNALPSAGDRTALQAYFADVYGVP